MLQPQTISSSLSFPILLDEPELNFEGAVTEAVDDILSSLGQNAKQAIYNHLESAFGISKEDIPRKIKIFADAIEETFGSAGKVIEIKIIEKLHAQYADFSYTPKSKELDFVEYVTHIRDHFEPEP